MQSFKVVSVQVNKLFFKNWVTSVTDKDNTYVYLQILLFYHSKNVHEVTVIWNTDVIRPLYFAPLQLDNKMGDPNVSLPAVQIIHYEFIIVQFNVNKEQICKYSSSTRD